MVLADCIVSLVCSNHQCSNMYFYSGVSPNSSSRSLSHIGASVSRSVGAVGSGRARCHLRTAAPAAAAHAGPAKPCGIGAHTSARDHLSPRATALSALAAAALDGERE